MDENVKVDLSITTNGDEHVSPKPARSSLHHRVVIVGAGAAGLGAAMKLHQAGIDFVVLEAQNQAGGRIQTHYYDGGCLELGAQWVHGEENNLLYDFCLKNNLLSDLKVDRSFEGKGLFLLPDGALVPESVVESAIMILDGVKEELATFKYNTSQQCESLGFKSVGEMYRARFEESRPRGPDNDSIMKAFMDWYTKFEIVDNACSNIDNLSLCGFSQYVECAGVYYINFKDGYESFTRKILENLPEDRVRLSMPVKQLRWSEESEIVEVLAENGAFFTCDHLIITSSIRVLKNFDFQPALPTYKVEALSCFGFDTIDKIFLIWDEPFWSEDTLGFQILWSENDHEFFKTNGEYLRGIYGFEKVNHNRNVLITWIGGDGAQKMETLTDETILDNCFELLKKFASKVVNVTRPSRLIRSMWGSNPYVRGAYSHRVLNFDHFSDAVEKLQRPLCSSESQIPRLLFAGEATDPDYFSTVHGALRTGYREAQRLIDL